MDDTVDLMRALLAQDEAAGLERDRAFLLGLPDQLDALAGAGRRL